MVGAEDDAADAAAEEDVEVDAAVDAAVASAVAAGTDADEVDDEVSAVVELKVAPAPLEGVSAIVAVVAAASVITTSSFDVALVGGTSEVFGVELVISIGVDWAGLSSSIIGVSSRTATILCSPNRGSSII